MNKYQKKNKRAIIEAKRLRNMLIFKQFKNSTLIKIADSVIKLRETLGINNK